MQIVSSKWEFYLEYINSLGLGLINNSAHEFKVAMLGDTYAPNIVSHKNWSEIKNHEISAYSYPSGGVTITNKKYILNEIEGAYYWSANDVIFYMGDVVYVKYMVLYNNTPIKKPLVCWAYVDASQDVVTGVNFKISIGDIYKIGSGN